jgi:hypothetical protein
MFESHHRTRYVEYTGQKDDQAVVGFAIHGRGGNSNLQGLPCDPGQFVVAGARL